MMYSEFLTLSGKTENYISYIEYTNEIEPIYTDCELSKADFIKLMDTAFSMIVHPAVEKAINSLASNWKYCLAFESRHNDNPEVAKTAQAARERVEKVDRAARKAAYEYMKVFSKL